MRDVNAINRMVVVLCTLFSVLYSRNRIIPMSAPGMAPKNATNCQPQSLERSVLLECLYGILRTRWSVATRRRREGRNKLLVKAYGENQQAGKHEMWELRSW